jgi:hypothetical protein
MFSQFSSVRTKFVLGSLQKLWNEFYLFNCMVDSKTSIFVNFAMDIAFLVTFLIFILLSTNPILSLRSLLPPLLLPRPPPPLPPRLKSPRRTLTMTTWVSASSTKSEFELKGISDLLEIWTYF